MEEGGKEAMSDTLAPLPSSQLRHRHNLQAGNNNGIPGSGSNNGIPGYVSQDSTPVTQHHQCRRSHTINLGNLNGDGRAGTRSGINGASRLDEVLATLEAEVEEEDCLDESSMASMDKGPGRVQGTPQSSIMSASGTLLPLMRLGKQSSSISQALLCSAAVLAAPVAQEKIGRFSVTRVDVLPDHPNRHRKTATSVKDQQQQRMRRLTWSSAATKIKSKVMSTVSDTHSRSSGTSLTLSGQNQPTSRPVLPPEMMSEEALAIAHARTKHRRAVFNVGGSRHEVLWSTLDNVPNSRLGRLRDCASFASLRELCDDFDLDKNEYFFDRHPKFFPSLLDFYRTGHLHLLEDMCVIAISKDLEYWGIDEIHIDSCCQLRYNQRKDEVRDISKELEAIAKTDKKIQKARMADSGWAVFKLYIWDVFEAPKSSIAAQIIALLSISFILLSSFSLTITTLPIFFGLDDYGLPQENEYLSAVEAICIGWFTIEYIIRLSVSPIKKAFLKGPLNIIDLIAILPFYVSVIITAFIGTTGFYKVRLVLQVLRILRVLRILKLARHSTGLQSLGFTIKNSYQELGLLLTFLGMGVLIISSMAYFAERETPNSNFKSIPATFWWATITMTTVGYGDVVPQTTLGKVLGVLCCIFGVLIVALPIPIISKNFTDFYKNKVHAEREQKRTADLAKVAANAESCQREKRTGATGKRSFWRTASQLTSNDQSLPSLLKSKFQNKLQSVTVEGIVTNLLLTANLGSRTPGLNSRDATVNASATKKEEQNRHQSSNV